METHRCSTGKTPAANVTGAIPRFALTCQVLRASRAFCCVRMSDFACNPYGCFRKRISSGTRIEPRCDNRFRTHGRRLIKTKQIILWSGKHRTVADSGSRDEFPSALSTLQHHHGRGLPIVALQAGFVKRGRQECWNMGRWNMGIFAKYRYSYIPIFLLNHTAPDCSTAGK